MADTALNESAKILKCPSTLLVGPPGSGKTTSLVTYIEAGLDLFVLVTDPGGEEALIQAMDARDLPMSKLHYHYVAAATPSWATLQNMARKIGALGYKDLSELKTGIDKQDYQQFFELLGIMADFTCQHCGEAFGPIDEFDHTRAFALDSLSGLNIMAMKMMIGAKPTAHQGEWGVAMNAEEELIRKCCADLRCFFALLAHVEREMDEVIGHVQLMAGALGRKLAPKLPKDFSDVIITIRDSDQFRWSTTMNNVDLKARTLPLSDKLQPSFGPIVEAWRERQKLVESSQA